MNREELFEKAKLLPATPGVYIMKNRSGRIIYVGKSKALKNRVTSYFAPYQNHFGKTLKMVNSVYDFEIYHTKTELEALLLENQFIKQHMPHYNIKQKDSDSYPYITVTSERFPKIDVCYRRDNNKDRYFGPFSSYRVAKDIVETVQKTFKIPSCSREFPKETGRGRPCLYYQINQCVAPCKSGAVTEKEYNELIDEALHYLRGEYGSLTKSIKEKMEEASEQMLFEKAAKLRDKIRSLEKISDKQQIVASPQTEADVFGIYSDDLGSAFVVFFVRGGAIIDRESLFFGADEIVNSGSVSSFMQRFYELREYIPKRIVVDFSLHSEDRSLLSEWLTQKNGSKISIITPKRGESRALADRASENAKQLFMQKRAEEDRNNTFLASFAKFLKLGILPDRIEAYDISNNGKMHTTCGMIVLERGRFAKKKYRSFNIKTTSGQDDCGALREALTRRFSHSGEDENWEYPDLILMDGGVAQVSAAKEVLSGYGLDISVYGMVKDEHHKTRTLTNGEGELSLNKRQDIYVFIYKIQEEVHRYSLLKMDHQRRKTVKTSSLTSIKGIGEVKSNALLSNFGSYKALKNATVEQLTEVKGIDERLANEIYKELRKKSD
ncbi:MAG: excinuclease ABC subunit UvrC [Eubacteriales bacterium]|nr:excinuclease ABC subunit UvrC [Eubacteriales bacterium]MDD4422111.1 excinuclease ABC subunit UvrC [Eubacteriales bacterium]